MPHDWGGARRIVTLEIESTPFVIAVAPCGHSHHQETTMSTQTKLAVEARPIFLHQSGYPTTLL